MVLYLHIITQGICTELEYGACTNSPEYIADWRVNILDRHIRWANLAAIPWLRAGIFGNRWKDPWQKPPGEKLG